MLSAEVQARINEWLTGEYDVQTKQEIQTMLDQGMEDELTNAFYKELEFGTGGLRGIMGVGSNQMNKYTVASATQGIYNYLHKCFPGKQIKVAIAYDSRNNSRYFAEITAEVLSANGAKVYLFEELRPTPELSFAIRHFKCHSGVVITASHNPKEYNGYKAYFNDGAQMVAPHDKNTIAEVRKIKSLSEIRFGKIESNIQRIGKEVDEEYLNHTHSLSISKEAISRQKDLSIVYTALHGTGITLVPDLLKKFGFQNVHIVEKQAISDGNFPTTPSPNPEEKEALSMAIEEAEKIGAELVMATDPDADRVGIAVRDLQNKWILLNGNQTGVLLMHYMLQAWKNAGKLNGKQYVVKTIVTSYMMDAIAARFGVECMNVLTGFKYIAEIIRQKEGKEEFIVGGEESYGYLVGEFVRDKDAVASCAFIAEMAASAKDQGKTLYEQLLDLYLEYGLYKEKLKSITKPGKTGQEEIKSMMERFRKEPPKSLGGSKVTHMYDYENHLETNFLDGSTKRILLPTSDVLQYRTEDGSLISARPSGTEPKIKFYFSVKTELKDKAHFDLKNQELDVKIDQILKDLGV